jgi:hypothetical protein
MSRAQVLYLYNCNTQSKLVCDYNIFFYAGNYECASTQLQADLPIRLNGHPVSYWRSLETLTKFARRKGLPDTQIDVDPQALTEENRVISE